MPCGAPELTEIELLVFATLWGKCRGTLKVAKAQIRLEELGVSMTTEGVARTLEALVMKGLLLPLRDGQVQDPDGSGGLRKYTRSGFGALHAEGYRDTLESLRYEEVHTLDWF